MKTLLTVLAILALNGCATWAPYDHHEYCALQGMKLQGVTDSRSMVSAWGANGSSAWGVGGGTSVSCAVPETPKDKCEVERWNQIAGPKVEYNESVGTKRVINGFADLLIVPGVVAHVIYAGQKNDAIKQSTKLYQMLGRCQEDGRMPGSISTSSAN